MTDATKPNVQSLGSGENVQPSPSEKPTLKAACQRLCRAKARSRGLAGELSSAEQAVREASAQGELASPVIVAVDGEEYLVRRSGRKILVEPVAARL